MKPAVEKEKGGTWLISPFSHLCILSLAKHVGQRLFWKGPFTLSSVSAITNHFLALSTNRFLSCQRLLESNLTCLLLLFSQVSMVRPHYFRLGFSVATKHFLSFLCMVTPLKLWEIILALCMLEDTDWGFKKRVRELLIEFICHAFNISEFQELSFTVSQAPKLG